MSLLTHPLFQKHHRLHRKWHGHWSMHSHHFGLSWAMRGRPQWWIQENPFLACSEKFQPKMREKERAAWNFRWKARERSEEEEGQVDCLYRTGRGWEVVGNKIKRWKYGGTVSKLLTETEKTAKKLTQVVCGHGVGRTPIFLLSFLEFPIFCLDLWSLWVDFLALLVCEDQGTLGRAHWFSWRPVREVAILVRRNWIWFQGWC